MTYDRKAVLIGDLISDTIHLGIAIHHHDPADLRMYGSTINERAHLVADLLEHAGDPQKAEDDTVRRHRNEATTT